MSCVTNPVSGQKQLMLLSEKDELTLGKEWYPNILWSAEGGGGEYKDEKLKTYLKGLILEINKVSHRPHLPIDFVIQNTSLPNAWAIPGHVAITRGLLQALESEAEFVYIMGHEIGHISARHSASQISKSIIADFLLTGASYSLSGKAYGDLALTLGSIGTNLVLLKYSRNDELEADRLGVEYMTKLGYDPKNALKAHLSLKKASEEYLKKVGRDSDEGNFFSELLSTHPRTSVRMEELSKIVEMSKLPYLRGDGTQKKKFQEEISDLKRTHNLYITYYDPAVAALRKNRIREADALIEKAINEKRDEPAFYALKGFIELRKLRSNVAEEYFKKAIELDPDYQPAYRGLGIVYFEKNEIERALPFFKKALSIFPNDVSSHFFLGMSNFRLKIYEKAIPHLEVATKAFMDHPSIYGTLGICYEKQGNLRKAYEAYSKQLQVAPDNEMGRYAKNRLSSMGK
ncbi:MAG: M48 family metalloprotease [Deltaproteobacteria bacterium]|nr:M48 family metalloprotease [Deltaproteobacteria bacterium]